MVMTVGKSLPSLTSGRAPGRAYDEMLSPDGTPRPHWKQAEAFFSHLGDAEIERRWSQARKVLHDNGVAYNLYSDAENPLRAWELNPIPLCIAADEWDGITAAVSQRARLLNGLLNDIYGPQEVLKKGLIPSALIKGNAAFLRPCHGVPIPNDARLIFYSADLARSPDGRWWALSDRTQAPSGMGYALENRVVLSRVFPEIFRSARIARLGGFFERVKKGLDALSPRGSASPNVVLLTPGRFNETYFEHAYLARQLGYMLVQGQDLTVRDDRVFIKTLRGLQQVDVILRRVDEEFCDPLELRDDSLLGVPGLLGAIRSGTVILANALGSGVVQSPALGAFLPGLCREMLGEELLMPSVATWWCGEDRAREYVRDNLAGLTLREAFPSYGGPAKPAAGDVDERPEFFAAQEMVQLSQAPHFHHGAIHPGSVILRVFAVRCGDKYEVMPGGLTRVTDGSSSQGLLLQQAGGSKDTWIEVRDPDDAPPVFESFRVPSDLTSRIADDLFWLGRYAARGEFTARLARASLESLSEEQGWRDAVDIAPFTDTLRHLGQLESTPETGEQLERALVHELRAPGKIGNLRGTLLRLRDIAMAVRDHVTDDAWRILNRFSDTVIPPDALSINEAASQLNEIVLHFAAFNGIFGENMTHGVGWRFVDLGRNIERAASTARLLIEVVSASSADDVSRFEILLEIFDATISYRQKYQSVRAEAVLELLLCEEANPRSLAAQFVRILDDLEHLPRETESQFHLPEERAALRALSDLRLFEATDIAVGGARLLDVLNAAEKSMNDCSELLTRRLFTHLRTSTVGRDMASLVPPPAV